MNTERNERARSSYLRVLVSIQKWIGERRATRGPCYLSHAGPAPVADAKPVAARSRPEVQRSALEDRDKDAAVGLLLLIRMFEVSAADRYAGDRSLQLAWRPLGAASYSVGSRRGIGSRRHGPHVVPRRPLRRAPRRALLIQGQSPRRHAITYRNAQSTHG